ncbi:unnamed protein product, partial [Acanthoscelides obtectus]
HISNPSGTANRYTSLAAYSVMILSHGNITDFIHMETNTHNQSDAILLFN